MTRLSKLRINVGPVSHESRGNSRVVKLHGHVEGRLSVGCMRSRKRRPPGQQVGNGLHVARSNCCKQPGEVGVVLRDGVGRGAAPDVRGNDRVEFCTDVLDVGLEPSPARKAELSGDGELCIAELRAWIAGAEGSKAILAQFLEPLEAGAKRERSGHDGTFFQSARCPRLASRKKAVMW